MTDGCRTSRRPVFLALAEHAGIASNVRIAGNWNNCVKDAHLLYIGGVLQAKVGEMSLLAQLFRHSDGAPADSDDVVSLGAIVSALDGKQDEALVAGIRVTTEVPVHGDGLPISAEPVRDMFVAAEKTPAQQVEPRPPEVAAIAAKQISIAPGDAAKAEPSAGPSVILAAHGDAVSTAAKSSPGVHERPHFAAPAIGEGRGISREATAFILRPLKGGVPSSASSSSPPVILAPRTMQNAEGAPPPVYLVPSGATPPETAGAESKEEPHGTV